MTDLVCLVADNSMQAAVSELLDRPHALGIRSITKEIPVHQERDSGCCYAPMKVLRAYRGSAKHALIILDHDCDGVPETTGAALESFIEERLERDGIEGWAVPVVIDPELEAWVFSDSPHVDKVLGWTNRNPTLREALEQQKLWGSKDSKPADPKAALEWVLKTAGRRPISSAHFRNLARRVSTKRCQDRAFLRFRKLLQDWFPPNSSFNSNPGFDHPAGDGTNIVGHKVKTGKKLIEVALPLDAINAASVREKSIRHGHPSTLHLWWARRPLAAARAVIFSQMVDDPSAHPDRFPTEQAQTQERERLFGLIEKLVKWENTNDAKVLEQAREEIRESWLRTCIDNADHPRAAERFDPDRLPAFHDPFAGGGALPLEAQRLGLEAHASDLNPVAVLINKAMIEIPPRFAGRPPVNPNAQAEFARGARWNGKGAQGLAEDVRYYGRWMRDEAEKRIGHLYPKVEVTEAMAAERPDLKGYVGRKLTVIAWLWARTVKSPNPAFAHVDVPLASTFMLSTKKGKEAWVEPVIEDGGYRFTVKAGAPEAGVPEAGASEAGIPEAGIPEAGVPGNGAPGAEADVPETGASETDVPETGASETGAPGTAGVPRAQASSPTFVIPPFEPGAGSAKAGIHSSRDGVSRGDTGIPPPSSSFPRSSRRQAPRKRESMRLGNGVSREGTGVPPAQGTKLGRGANFRCLMSDAPIPGDCIKAEGKAGHMGARLMVIIAEGDRGRVYLAPTPEQESAAQKAAPEWKPDVEFFQQALGFRIGNYGMTKWSDLFTPRQLVALTTFSDLLQEAIARIEHDALRTRASCPPSSFPRKREPMRPGERGRPACLHHSRASGNPCAPGTRASCPHRRLHGSRQDDPVSTAGAAPSGTAAR